MRYDSQQHVGLFYCSVLRIRQYSSWSDTATRCALSSIHSTSAAVAVDSSRMTASSSASWSRFSPPSHVVNGHVSTMWFMVCRRPQSQEGDWARPHLCKLARHGPWPVRKRFIRDHVGWGRLKPGCRIVGSVTVVWLSTEADIQLLHCVTVSTDVMSDHIGHQEWLIVLIIACVS